MSTELTVSEYPYIFGGELAHCFTNLYFVKVKCLAGLFDNPLSFQSCITSPNYNPPDGITTQQRHQSLRYHNFGSLRMAHDMSNVQMFGWTTLVVSSWNYLLYPHSHKAKNQTLQNECGTQDESIPAIHPFWRLLPHLHRRLCSTQGIFQNSWRCFCLGGWLGRLGNGSICTPNLWF